METLVLRAFSALVGFAFVFVSQVQTVRAWGEFHSQNFGSLPPPAIKLEPVVSGLSSPLYVTNAGDSRLFIVEQTGLIRIFQGGTPTTFLNLTPLTACCGERGVLGMAFHPDYPATPYFYVHFTSDGDVLPDGTDPALGNNVIVRYNVSANPNVADAASGKTLLVIPQPFSNHNGGTIEFGNDGYLYIAKGDGGSANDPGNRAQNISLLLGKILRLDVNQNINTPPYHGIPPTNPFVGTAGADEIFLVGLRNPFRFSFDRANGDLWIGDVGQGSLEEIDRLPINASAPGKNLGWRIYEGTECTDIDPCVPPANYLPPIAQYSHAAGRCSITGGYVYRGTQIPGLLGDYLYADYCTGEIFRLDGTTQELVLDSPHNISSFGEDGAGELYVTALGGQLFRIEPLLSAANATVSGRITDSNGRGIPNVIVTMTGEGSAEPFFARTNPFGYYQLPPAEVGQSYLIVPSAKGRTFSPENRFITLTQDLSDADFEGSNQGYR